MNKAQKSQFGFTLGETIRLCEARSFAAFSAAMPFPATARLLAQILRLRRPERRCHMLADVQGVRL